MANAPLGIGALTAILACAKVDGSELLAQVVLSFDSRRIRAVRRPVQNLFLLHDPIDVRIKLRGCRPEGFCSTTKDLRTVWKEMARDGATSIANHLRSGGLLGRVIMEKSPWTRWI